MAKPAALVSLCILLSALFFVSAALAFSYSTNPQKDPERQLEQCRADCQQRHPGQSECQQRCQKQYEEQKEQSRGGGGGGGQRGEGDPKQQLQQCKSQCRHDQTTHPRECEDKCEKQYKEQTGGSRGGDSDWNKEDTQSEGREEQETRENPYFFDEKSFTHRIRTEEGSIRVLKRFSELSELLQGYDNYRLVVQEANPRAFEIPNHWDAESVIYVVRGNGIINLLRENNKEAYNLHGGDIFRIPAGITAFVVNRDNKEKLHIVQILRPVSTPGHYEEFFGVGGEDPETFFKSFSSDLLEAAFKTPRERLEKLFGQQNKGPIIKASEEQIKAIGRHASSSKGGHQWPFGETSGPFNLLEKKPTHSNNYGELYEADENDYKPLRYMNVQVSFANISSGAMTMPFFNSESTKFVWVVDGSGYYEMICPHLSNQQQRGGSQQQEGGRGQEREEEHEAKQQQEGGGRRVRYQRVRSNLSPNTGYVVPAGHAVVSVASRNQNLQLVCFEVNSRGNEKSYLAGGNNILRHMDKVEKELSFNVPAREVEEILNAQREVGFGPGPEQHRQEREGGGSHGALESILDFVSF